MQEASNTRLSRISQLSQTHSRPETGGGRCRWRGSTASNCKSVGTSRHSGLIHPGPGSRRRRSPSKHQSRAGCRELAPLRPLTARVEHHHTGSDPRRPDSQRRLLKHFHSQESAARLLRRRLVNVGGVSARLKPGTSEPSQQPATLHLC